MIDRMQAEGIVGPADGSRPREILVKNDYLERMQI
jgi:DNA segregation ATPase FtsK/SpoIIIE-like protein